MATLCQACNNPSQKTCSRCHCSRYCSKECQKADWATHKLLCNQYATFNLSTRPSKDHFLAIVFSPDKTEPHFTWLHSTMDGNTPTTALKPHLFPDGRTKPIDGATVEHSLALDRDLLNTVHVYYRDEFFFDGSLPNRGVRAATKVPGYARFDWRGPVLVCGTVGNAGIYCREFHQMDFRQGLQVRDIDLLDFRHAVDFLRTKSAALNSTDANLGGRMQAVRINCQGAETTHRLPLLEALTVTLKHPLLKGSEHLAISARVGHPLVMLNDPRDPTWQGATPVRNDTARHLRLGCVNYDTSPAPGSVVVTREDRLPLDPLYIEGLARFCQEEIAQRFATPQPRQVVLASITKPEFEAFYAKFLQQTWEKNQARREKS